MTPASTIEKSPISAIDFYWTLYVDEKVHPRYHVSAVILTVGGIDEFSCSETDAHRQVAYLRGAL